MHTKVFIFFVGIFFLLSSDVIAQSVNTTFGKNRVQYHKDFEFWDKYETESFVVYWYGRNRYLGQAAIQMAELDHDEIRKVIEHRINDKIEIIVYTDLSDLKQSNIGIDDAFQNIAGQTKIAGNKMFVYFDGNHQHLREQIREGIASVYLGAMMLGSNFQEILQNSVLLDLPQWFTDGIVGFAGDPWNIYIEDELRDVLYREKKLWKFDKLAEKYPKLAGHSLWNYISLYYGKSTISNIIYLTKISRDLKGSFQFVLNKSLDRFIDEWEDYYTQLYKSEEGRFDEFNADYQLKLSNKKYNPVSVLSPSPNGKFLVYAHNKLGKMKIVLKDLESGKEKTIFKKGFKNAVQETDFNYPQVAWHPTGSEFTFSYMHKDDIVISKYDLQTDKLMKQAFPKPVQRIYSLSYIDDRFYLVAGAVEGVSDLFTYDSKDRVLLNITSDYYDDLDAEMTTIDGQRGILFASNRPVEHILPNRLDTLLPLKNFDIFFYPFEGAKDEFEMKALPKFLTRYTYTTDENERYPLSVENGAKIVYLNDKTGFINTVAYDITNEKTTTLSNVNRNLIRHGASGDQYFYTAYHDGQYKVYEEPLDYTKTKIAAYTEQKKSYKDRLQDYQDANPEVQEAVKEGYKFQSKFPDPVVLNEIDEEDKLPIISTNLQEELPDISDKKSIEFKNSGITASGFQFKFHDVVSTLDNNVLFEGLELFGGQNPQINQIPMGILLKASASDLFEDHRLEGGLRIPTSFNGSEFFLIYNNDKHLLDKRISLYRRSFTEENESDANPFTKAKKDVILGMYQLKYPFNIYSSLRAIGSLRFDRNYQKAINESTFSAPIDREKRIGIRLEYVYDNTFDYGINVMHGSRAKFYVEAQNQFELDAIDGIDFTLSQGITSVVGFDARHYIPILKHSVLALRGAGAFSFGSKPNLYYLGGVNNSLFNSFDQNVPVANKDFAFKGVANNLRGFMTGVRNGTNFSLVNAELRIPFLQYLLGKNKGISFFRNMQLVGFADAGLAWYGWSPYSDKNPINVEYVDGGLVQLQINYFRDPLVAAYGLGFRTQILGYFVRVDYAYGVETRIIQKPKFHLSVGLDF
ncbi:MAG: hypothetical protein IPL23_03065 [Saprospiraceae bacterium]|nr:hypothetical protein [Saprospiraceae bacterium]